MSQPCYLKGKSDPPLCGVHNVPLVKRNTDHKFGSAEVKPFDYWVCSKSRNVIRENPEFDQEPAVKEPGYHEAPQTQHPVRER